MTTIILTKTHLYADRQVSTFLRGNLECCDCNGTNIVAERDARAESKIVIPTNGAMYEGSPILAISSAGSRHAGERYKRMIVEGKCPVKVIEDFRMIDKYEPSTTTNVIIVTEADVYQLFIGPREVRRRKVNLTDDMLFMGSGARIGEALIALFPGISAELVLSTIIEHDSGTGGPVDVLHYRGKKKALKTIATKDLPAALKNLKIPKGA